MNKIVNSDCSHGLGHPSTGPIDGRSLRERPAVQRSGGWQASDNTSCGSDIRAEAAQWFAAVLGKEHVLWDEESRVEYAKTTLPSSTKPAMIVRPKDVSDVQQIVTGANRFGLKPHAISRGKNWGYGDACAPRDGQLIVDLRRMDRIVEINEELAYAVIEPGVTQGQLAGELLARGSRLMLDVTGAGPDASIVGNILQRGFGHTPYGDRVAHSCNYQYITLDGELRHTGFGAVTESVVGHVYPYGNGPCEQGMLAQSSVAVVTRMTIWLMPRPEVIEGFGFKTNDSRVFVRIVNAIGRLRQDGTINSVVHLANDIRVLSTQPCMKEYGDRTAPFTTAERRELCHRAGIASWSGLGGLYGSKHAVAAKKRDICRTFRSICPVRFFSKRHVGLLNLAANHLPKLMMRESLRNLTTAVNDVFDLLNGFPTPKHLEGAFFRNRPQSGQIIDSGLIWIAPVIPFTGDDLMTLISVIEPIANRFLFDLPITVSPVSPRAAVCIANISYDKADPLASQKAWACYRQIESKLSDHQYRLYRSASVPV